MAATRMSFSFPDELKEKMQELADKEDRTVSAYIKLVLTKHLKSVNKPKKTKRKRA